MKKIILTLIIVFSFCAFLQATDVRINGLGVMNYMVADDDTLMQIFPAQIANYQNTLELSTVSTTGFLDYTIGNIACGLQYMGYTGTVSMPTTNGNSVFNSYTIALPNPAMIYPLTKTLSLEIGMKLSELSSAAMTIGFSAGGDEGKNSSINPQSSSYVFDTKRNSSDVSLGLGYSVKNLLDIGLQAGIPTINNSGYENLLDGQPYIDETMKMTYGIYGKANARILFLPLIIGASSSMVSEEINDFQLQDNNYDGNFTDYSDTNTKYTDIYRNYTFSLGASLNLQITQTITLIPGINISYSYTMNEMINTNYESIPYGTDTETDTGQWMVPVYIAAEDKINEYVTWRGGIKTYLCNYSYGNFYNYVYYPGEAFGFISQPATAPSVMSGISVYIGGLSVDSNITYGSGFTGNAAATLKF